MLKNIITEGLLFRAREKGEENEGFAAHQGTVSAATGGEDLPYLSRDGWRDETDGLRSRESDATLSANLPKEQQPSMEGCPNARWKVD